MVAQGAQFAAAPAVEEEGGEQQYEERYYCQSKSGKVKKVKRGIIVNLRRGKDIFLLLVLFQVHDNHPAEIHVLLFH